MNSVPPPASSNEMAGLLRAVKNALSMVASEGAIRAASFLLYALVARYLGAHELGQLSLGLSLFHTFGIIAVIGLDTLIAREVSRDKSKTDLYLINASLLMLVTGTLSSLLLWLFVHLMGYSADTATVVLWLGLGLLPHAMARICDGIFQAWEKMQYIVYANAPVNIAKVGLGFFLLWRGHGIYSIVLIVVGGHFAVLVIQWVLMLRAITRPKMAIDLRFSLAMLKATVPFLGIKATNAVKSSLSVVLLSKLVGETAVGLYSAATTLFVPLSLIFNNVTSSIFPIMCRRFDSGLEGLQRVTEHLVEIFVVLSLPIVVGFFFLAEPALLLIYGEQEFLRAVAIVQLIAWLPLQNALTTVMGQVLWASHYEKTTLRIAIINTAVQLVASFILISQLGLLGAAITSVFVALVNLLQHYRPVAKLLPNLSLLKSVWKPVAGAVGMSITFLLQTQTSLLTALPAVAVYAAVLFTLFVWSAGGPDQFKLKYLQPFRTN